MKNQKGLIQLLLIVGIAAAAGVIVWVLASGTKEKTPQVAMPLPSAYQADYYQGSDEVAPVENSSDLQTVSASLEDSYDAEFEAELQALEKDLAAF